jgi:hypothetical protein
MIHASLLKAVIVAAALVGSCALFVQAVEGGGGIASGAGAGASVGILGNAESTTSLTDIAEPCFDAVQEVAVQDLGLFGRQQSHEVRPAHIDRTFQDLT